MHRNTLNTLLLALVGLFAPAAWSATLHDAEWRESHTALDEIYPLVSLSDTAPNGNFRAGPVNLKTGLEEGGEENDAIAVYVPVESTSGTGNGDYFTGDVLPDISNDSTGSGLLHFRLQIDLEGGPEHYLYVAVENNPGEYKIVQDARYFNSNNDRYLVTVSFNDLCRGGEANCGQFASASSPPDRTDSTYLLFFLSESTYNSGDDIAEADFSAKLFYQLYFSNRINNTGEISLQEIFKGDGQLHATYRGFELQHIDSLYAYVIENTTRTCTFGDEPTTVTYAGRTRPPEGTLQFLDTTLVSGEARIEHLRNDRCYAIRLLYLDKFGFASRLSPRKAGSPEEILALLEKQSCYLLTAGFGRAHPVIDFFRRFRDEALLTNPLGHMFTRTYYATAPQFAPLILQSPPLAALIRASAYTLYYIVRTWKIWLPAGILLALMGFFSIRKRKCTHGRP